MRTTAYFRSWRSGHKGQAAIELIVALLVIVLLAAAALVVGEIVVLRGELFADIRAESGRRVLGASGSADVPQYLQTWQPGPDGILHTADDVAVADSAAGLRRDIAGRSVPDAAAWHWIETSGNPEMAHLADAVLWRSAFGLVQTRTAQSLPTPPAIRRWVDGRDEIPFAVEIWMPYTGGLE